MSSPAKLHLVPTTPRRAAAARLRRLRTLRGWSQEEAARRAGIGVRTLRDLESGKTRMTALELVEFYEQQLPRSVEATEETRVGQEDGAGSSTSRRAA